MDAAGHIGNTAGYGERTVIEPGGQPAREIGIGAGVAMGAGARSIVTPAALPHVDASGGRAPTVTPDELGFSYGPSASVPPTPPAGMSPWRQPSATLRPRAHLISVRRDGSDGEGYEILEASFEIGSRAGHLVLRDDPYLSDRHCRLLCRDGVWELHDLDSYNGVFLRMNGRRRLVDRDHLLLGKQLFCFDRLDPHAIDAVPSVQHGITLFGSPPVAAWGRLRQMTILGTTQDVYHLSRERLVIGREDGDLRFPDDEFMSRKHLTLSLREGEPWAEDLGSSNGTYARIRYQARVGSGDLLRIGDQLLRFELA